MRHKRVKRDINNRFKDPKPMKKENKYTLK